MKQIYFIVFVMFLVFSCGKNKEKHDENSRLDLNQIMESGELVVLTSSGSTSYFIYRGEEIGYQYELSKRLAKDLGLKLVIKVVPDINKLSEMLMNGEGDLIAYRLPITNELKDKISFLDKETITNQVLVQACSDTLVENVVDLIGKEVYVKANTKYADRLENLNEEIGGGIIIRTLTDSITTEELIEKVSQREIMYTVADNDVAQVNTTYYQNLDCTLPLSFSQRSAWAVRTNSPDLLAKINEWLDTKKTKKYSSILYRKYFTRSKYLSEKIVYIPPGKGISRYDEIIKRQAKKLHWDWRLLASLIYHESEFKATALAWSGASGLMQLMPETAEHMGLDSAGIFNPEKNIHAGVKYLKTLNRIFRRIKDDNERVKFVLAAYNAGVGHVFDARALAVKHGKNRDVWTDNVEIYIKLKSDPRYYNDPVCKAGYCRGDETYRYVRDIMARYKRYVDVGK